MGVFIHVGASKAASTTLQKHVFPNASGLNFLGKSLSGGAKYTCRDIESLVSDLVNLDRFSGNAPSIDVSGTTVISNEHFCESVCPVYQAQLFCDVFGPKVKILYIIRNQYDSIISHYRFAGSALRFVPSPYYGRTVSMESYLNFLEQTANNFGGHKARDWVNDYFRILDFDTFLSITETVIPKQNIIVLPFEQIVKDFGMVLRSIGLKSGPVTAPKANKSTGLSQRGQAALGIIENMPGQKWIRSAARQYLTPIHTAIAYGGQSVTLKDEQKEMISKRFGAANARLAKRYKLNLEDLDYPIE